MNLAEYYLSIISKSPMLGWDLNVPLQPTIVVRFNQPLNSSLVSDDAGLNKYVLLLDIANDATVTVTSGSWNAELRTLSFLPSVPLAPGGVYQVTVLKSLTTAQGRSMTSDVTWAFQTSAAALGQVTLSSPGDSTAWSTLPVLSWNAVFIPSGTVTYDVQVNGSWNFGSNPLWSTSTTTSVSGGILSVSIGTVLAGNTTYYWRVRARVAAATGEWSSTSAFWVGTPNQASPDTTILYNPGQFFRLASLVPADNTTHQSQWPLIQAVFTQPLSGVTVSDANFQIWQETVDGRRDIPPFQIPGSTFTNDGAGTITIAPGASIAKNTRYRLILTTGIRSASGDYLPEQVEIEWTGLYQPIYGGVHAVQSELGGFIRDLPEDEILFQLWRASLHANEILITRVHRIRMRATLNDLINYQPPGGTTWGMMRYAELAAAIQMLERMYFDTADVAGHRGTLATFEYQVDVALLPQIQDRIRDLRGQRAIAEAIWLQESVVPRTTGKSIRWLPDRIYPFAQDWSYRRRHRF